MARFFKLWWLSCVLSAARSIGEYNGVENRSCFMLPPVELLLGVEQQKGRRTGIRRRDGLRGYGQPKSPSREN
jgi:hypothetical protein